MALQIYTSGSGTFTVPSEVTSLSVIVIGCGENGSIYHGGGGGGLGYNPTLEVTPGQEISYSVAAGGSFSANTTFGDLYGGPGGRSGAYPGYGGYGSSYNGGNGGSGSGGASGGGGGGGSSGGLTTNGNDGDGHLGFTGGNGGSTTGLGLTVTGGGGLGGNIGVSGSNGEDYGGGGGGRGTGGEEDGLGAGGYIQIYWYTGLPPGEQGSGNGLLAYNAYFAFRNLAIPKNVVINNAFIRFTAQHGAGLYGGGNENDIVKVMLLGQAADTGTVPEDAFEAYAIEKTESCQNWDDIEPWEDDEEYDSPDIACVIQEIIDRPGWNPGNDITIFVMDYDSGSVGSTGSNQSRFLYDYDDDPSKSAKLFLYYALEESGTGGVVCGGTASNSITSINTYNEVASGGIVCAGLSIVKLKITKVATGGVVVAGLVVFADGGGGPSVSNCTGRGTNTSVGKLVQYQISANEDDGSWTYTYVFDDEQVLFGSITPEE